MGTFALWNMFRDKSFLALKMVTVGVQAVVALESSRKEYLIKKESSIAVVIKRELTVEQESKGILLIISQ